MLTIQEHRSQPSTLTNHSPCSWRLVRTGLNIEGLCTNSQCPAYNQMTIINLGFGEYDFARIILARKNQCPLCKMEVHPTKYALNQCQWWYVNHYGIQTFPLHTVGNTYVLKDLNCEYLLMEIMPLPFNYHESTEPQEMTCPICLINIEDDYEIIHLHCSHNFHQTCIDGWVQSNASMASTCPICREHIVERY